MGHWDEHLAVQTLINDLIEACDLPWLDNDVATFLLGVAQHEIYDLMVNERPVNVQRIDFHHVGTLKEEMPSIYLNVLGVGLSLWKTLKRYSVDRDKAELRRRLLGLLGAVTPDILEAIRLCLLPDGAAAWQRGDASRFHIKVQDWEYPVDTFQNPEQDLRRRGVMQSLTWSLELFNIRF